MNGKRKDVGRHIRRKNGAAARFAHDAEKYPRLIGCDGCPELGDCGGLHVGIGAHDCLSLCCNAPETCDRVCRNNPEVFVKRIREIDKFDLMNTPRSEYVPHPELPDILPYIYHGGSREAASKSAIVALPFSKVLNYRNKKPRFASRRDLCNSFKIKKDAEIILCGIDKDRRLEAWWEMTASERKLILVGLRAIGVAMITSPNYSLVMDRPRWDDLHAMKRIALDQAEIQGHGIATALHINARTDRDFERWAEFLMPRPEITCLAYDFLTGPGRPERQPQHRDWLCNLPEASGRKLDLIVRGAPQLLPDFRRYFRSVTFIEANSFMKTIRRQKAVLSGNSSLDWERAPTPRGAPVDHLYHHNVGAVDLWLRTRHGGIAI